jgi:hypothetical protein
MRAVEEPTIEKSSSGHRDYTVHHPAYAQISANRVSGGKVLYGSDFQHQNYVTVKITKSELHRNLSNDSAFGSSRPYIEVAMSEAQWAEFVSSMNVGFGVQCTLQYKDGKEIPGIPNVANQRETFKEEAAQRAEHALQTLAELREKIDALGISEKAKKSLRGHVNSAEAQLTSSMPFVLEQFAEHMERTVQKAKIEINAYTTHAVMRAGIAALDGKPILGALPE